MLDLESGVDFEEVAGPVGAAQELDGGDVREVGRGRDPHGRVVQPTALGGGEPGCRRLLDELLVTALDRAITFADRDDLSRLVAQDLDLDVARLLDLAFQVERPVAERGHRLRRSAAQGGRKIRSALDPSHPSSPTAGRGLDHQRVPDPIGLDEDRRQRVGAIDRHRVDRPGHRVDPDGPRQSSRTDLVAERVDRGRGRADEDEPGLRDGAGECRALGKEPVAGMDRVRAGGRSRIEDRLDATGSSRLAGGGPMRTASSARRTWRAPTSASL